MREVWKELSSQTAVIPDVSLFSAQNAHSGLPMFPAATLLVPFKDSAWEIKLVVVVFPFVPVTAIIFPRHAIAERSVSQIAVAPAASPDAMC